MWTLYFACVHFLANVLAILNIFVIALATGELLAPTIMSAARQYCENPCSTIASPAMGLATISNNVIWGKHISQKYKNAKYSKHIHKNYAKMQKKQMHSQKLHKNAKIARAFTITTQKCKI